MISAGSTQLIQKTKENMKRTMRNLWITQDSYMKWNSQNQQKGILLSNEVVKGAYRKNCHYLSKVKS